MPQPCNHQHEVNAPPPNTNTPPPPHRPRPTVRGSGQQNTQLDVLCTAPGTDAQQRGPRCGTRRAGPRGKRGSAHEGCFAATHLGARCLPTVEVAGRRKGAVISHTHRRAHNQYTCPHVWQPAGTSGNPREVLPVATCFPQPCGTELRRHGGRGKGPGRRTLASGSCDFLRPLFSSSSISPFLMNLRGTR